MEPKTVGDVVQRWLETRREQLREASYDAYRRSVERYILPLLGQVPLEELNREALQAFVGRLKESSLSEKSVWDINVKLNAALQWAAQQGYLDHAGYCVKMKFPKSPQLRTLDRQERQRLERTLTEEGDAVKTGLLLSLNTGLQLGELCALRWDDINLERGRLVVERRMQRLSNPEKNGGGKKTVVAELPARRREVPVPARMAALLKKLPHVPGGYLLTGEKNAYLEPRTVQFRLKRYLKESGLDEGIGFNMFRATYIRSQLEKGEDLCTVSQQVGAKRLAHIGEKYRDYVMRGAGLS